MKLSVNRFLLLIALVWQCNLIGQTHRIQKVEISSEALIKEITKYIDADEKENNTQPNSRDGYLSLFIYGKENRTTNYHLKFSYVPLKNLLKADMTPFAYTKVNNRLVVIFNLGYTNTVHFQLSKRDKRRLSKEIDKTLPLPTKLRLYNEKGELEVVDKNFRVMTPTVLSGKGICISIDTGKDTPEVRLHSHMRGCFFNQNPSSDK
ncbi:hypothetical protein MNBD_BACTEROID03-2385 [hydrothermal vent metagenome]|uniref:Uncharacterized protein n=1 Tax=hydrothermal vent metagenome TaxID=652676 RepID=A0A3B0U8U7_9ZZZZ